VQDEPRNLWTPRTLADLAKGANPPSRILDQIGSEEDFAGSSELRKVDRDAKRTTQHERHPGPVVDHFQLCVTDPRSQVGRQRSIDEKIDRIIEAIPRKIGRDGPP